MVLTSPYGSARTIALLVILITGTACGDNSPTAPTVSTPQVSGSYAGTVTVNLPEVQQSRTCPANTSVTQSGTAINIAPIVLTGTCGNLSVPMGPATIDTTGAITGQNTGTFFEPTCGGNYSVVASGGFFGRELRLSMSASSAVCLNFNFTAVLTR